MYLYKEYSEENEDSETRLNKKTLQQLLEDKENSKRRYCGFM